MLLVLLTLISVPLKPDQVACFLPVVAWRHNLAVHRTIWLLQIALRVIFKDVLPTFWVLVLERAPEVLLLLERVPVTVLGCLQRCLHLLLRETRSSALGGACGRLLVLVLLSVHIHLAFDPRLDILEVRRHLLFTVAQVRACVCPAVASIVRLVELLPLGERILGFFLLVASELLLVLRQDVPVGQIAPLRVRHQVVCEQLGRRFTVARIQLRLLVER